MTGVDGSREVFELRFDTMAPGRSAAAFRAAHAAAAAGRAAFGVPPPLAEWWTRLGGRRPPGLVSLYRWPGLIEREAQLGRYLASDAARALVWEGGAKGVIAGSESLILRAVAAADGVVAPAPAGRVHEMRIFRVLNGAVAEAAETLLANEFALARQAGAVLTGLYDVTLGPDRPQLVAMLAWPAGVAPSDVWLEIDAAAAARRLAERERHRRRLFLGIETILLEDLKPGEAR